MVDISSYPLNKIFPNLQPLLSNPAPFKEGWFDSGEYYNQIPDIPILVVGAGGLGSEIIKNLALSGVRNIHLIDMDTIDWTNLNRQFMFRKDDVGKYKADVVADFIKKRCPGVKITTHKQRVQELPYSFYTQFPIIIGGLDNVQARKYLNKLVFLINQQEMDTRCYYLDGATQGFEGQAIFVDAYRTSCYQCSILDGLAVQAKANYCTIANKPRTPEHCIQYVLQKQWQQQRKQEVRDNDNLQHLNWIYQKALARAKQFKIQGVTPMLSLGVTKNVIPAIASTNALIAAVTTNQAFKILTGCNPTLNNFFLYKGGTFIGSETGQRAKKPTCQACLTRQNRLQKFEITISRKQKFQQVLKAVQVKFPYVNKPFVDNNGKMFLNPGSHESFQQKMGSTIGDLITNGKLLIQNGLIVLQISDKCLKSELLVQVTLSD